MRGKYNSVSMLAGEKIKFSAWLFWHYRYSRLRMEISLTKNDLLPFPGLTRIFAAYPVIFFVIKTIRTIAGRGNLFQRNEG
ncbi:hypothetical protein ROL61_06865 [Cronobacter sakazakii]|uniref:hypothetical protein n=1 Tax=Cronobacter sakazakii TaxID=28141 RepID=UPI002894D96D|nr:hypothetical protein [Cronobacter sakazakii]MDT3630221.1 hypothetical protein [Cronobacter sakazakii]